MNTNTVVNACPVIPVMVIDQLADAVPLAQALVNGGLKVLEITLRTPAALEAIKLIKQEVPEAIVGAGTVVNENTLEQALKAGSEFVVTPGTTTNLVKHALASEVPLLPGVNTPSEAMTLLEKGITTMKFFPAEAAGGIPMLKSIGGPLPQLQFCPTGGITAASAVEYLKLNNVACVGGSWLTPVELIKQQRWSDITALASHASQLPAFKAIEPATP